MKLHLYHQQRSNLKIFLVYYSDIIATHFLFGNSGKNMKTISHTEHSSTISHNDYNDKNSELKKTHISFIFDTKLQGNESSQGNSTYKKDFYIKCGKAGPRKYREGQPKDHMTLGFHKKPTNSEAGSEYTNNGFIPVAEYDREYIMPYKSHHEISKTSAKIGHSLSKDAYENYNKESYMHDKKPLDDLKIKLKKSSLMTLVGDYGKDLNTCNKVEYINKKPGSLSFGIEKFKEISGDHLNFGQNKNEWISQYYNDYKK